MARKLQIKRGAKANLPTLSQGEFAMTTDSGAEGLFIGNGTTNLEVALKRDIADSVPISSGTADLTAGESTLAAGSVYLVYEE